MNEALAILDWYAAMGVDELLEETPQNRLTAKPKRPPLKTAAAPSSSPATAQPAAAALLQETQALADAAQTLAELEQAVKNFKGLSICKTATNPVFADGIADSQLMIIGEAPGAQEDRQGVPFCGPSGHLLDKMLAAIGHDRKKNCYISNVIFWRPPGNRNPSPEEIAVCRPFVQKHIALIRPKVLFLAGGVAIRALLEDDRSIGRLRGQVHSYHNPVDNRQTPVVVSYHPSYLLRMPTQKRLAWDDLLLLKAQLA